jgi:hypothetical protein
MTIATIAIDTLIVTSGQIDAHTFETYVCMKGLWVYSRYSQAASSRLAADWTTNNGVYLEPSTEGSLVDRIFWSQNSERYPKTFWVDPKNKST